MLFDECFRQFQTKVKEFFKQCVHTWGSYNGYTLVPVVSEANLILFGSYPDSRQTKVPCARNKCDFFKEKNAKDIDKHKCIKTG